MDDNQVKPQGYWNPLTKQYEDTQPAVEDSSFLPFGMEDWLNPAGWSRAVAKKITNRAATKAAEAAVPAVAKETTEVVAKPGAVGSILAKLRGKIPEEKLDKMAVEAVQGGPTTVHVLGDKGEIVQSFKPGTPLHKELSERGREIMAKPAQNLTYGTATRSKKFEMDGGVLERARRKRTMQVMEMLTQKNQSTEGNK